MAIQRAVSSDLSSRFNLPGLNLGVQTSTEAVQSSIQLPDSILIPTRYDQAELEKNKSLKSEDCKCSASVYTFVVNNLIVNEEIGQPSQEKEYDENRTLVLTSMEAVTSLQKNLQSNFNAALSSESKRNSEEKR